MVSFLLTTLSRNSSFSFLLKTVSVSPIRQAASKASFDIKEERISKHMLLKKLTHGSRGDKPLVLMFDWLYAKPSAVAKYCNLYHSKGMDVLVINGKLQHFLWPPIGFKLANSVLEYLTKARSGKEKFLVHAFSIGAYNYTLMLIHASGEKKFKHLRANTVGQVLDSIVIGTYDNMSTGIASTFTPNKAVRSLTLFFMNTYYNLTRKHTRDRYDEYVHYFIHNPVEVPTLIFYSLNDPMCDTKAMRNLINTWRTNFPELDVAAKSWKKSVHAAHIKYHEQEYLESWENFIRKIKGE